MWLFDLLFSSISQIRYVDGWMDDLETLNP